MPRVNTHTLNTMIRAKRSFSINESTCVADVDYDEESQELTIQFNARGTYKYLDVPLDVYVDFSTAGSRGKYFNLYIRPTYQFERIS